MFTSLHKFPDVIGQAEMEFIFPTAEKEKCEKKEEGWAFIVYNIGLLQQLLQVLELCFPKSGQVSLVNGK